jgi:hypothetical protein
LAVLFNYILLVCKKKISSQIKGFLLFVCTPYVFKKGYTYDAFLTSTIKVMLVKDMLVSLFKKLVRQLQEGPGQQGRAAGQPEDLQADLQMLPMAAGTSILHIIKIEVFLHFFN